MAPGSPILQWDGERHRLGARSSASCRGRSPTARLAEATIEFSAIVWIEPAADPNVWGDPGEHQLFEHVVRMSDGTWRMWDSGTGP